MRYLFYTNYQSGHSGLSNAIMSIEIGVVLAFLTNRFLLLDGNISPPANVVSYNGRVDNSRPSRVSDLIELPVAWNEPDSVDLTSLNARELTDHHLMNSVFYLPQNTDIESADALAFANGRTHWLYETDEIFHTPMLKVSEQPIVLSEARHRNNLGFYCYFFYLDAETRRAVYSLLKRMQAKAPYLDLARKVAADLGSFNAVHMRRGDFKVTYGVTVLERQPWEAIEAMDHHFERNKRLLIVTDERDDPFFEELCAAYPDHVFLDHHILDNYGQEFAALPQHDSIALAHLSQLVAAESEDFIGTMTSTFTALIHRYRGNRGKNEVFKFLWNELPAPGTKLERGRHPVSECIPLEHGIMVEEFTGPYSWNRHNRLLNPAWMREWPESFLTDAVLSTGIPAGYMPVVIASADNSTDNQQLQVLFENLRINITSTVPELLSQCKSIFNTGRRASSTNIIAELKIEQHEEHVRILKGERLLEEIPVDGNIVTALIRALVPMLTDARRLHTWLHGLVFRQAQQTIIYTGDTSHDEHRLTDNMRAAGWELLGDQAIPIWAKGREVVPFACTDKPEKKPIDMAQSNHPLSAIVYGKQRLHGRDAISQLAPSLAVARLIGQSIDFRFDRDRAVQRLVSVLEHIPVYEASFSQTGRLPVIIGFLAEQDNSTGAPHERP